MANVLVVDDEQIQAKNLSYHLRAKGHSVNTAFDLGEALRSVRSSSYDCVVTDKNLGAWRGVTPLLDYMAEERPFTPIIVVTGEFTDQAEKELRAHAFVCKINFDTYIGEICDLVPGLIEEGNKGRLRYTNDH